MGPGPPPFHKTRGKNRLPCFERGEIPVLERKFPVSSKEFPITLDREFSHKLLNFRAERSPKYVEWANFPC